MKPNYRMRRSNMRILEEIQERKIPKLSLKEIFYHYKSNTKKKVKCKAKKKCNCK